MLNNIGNIIAELRKKAGYRCINWELRGNFKYKNIRILEYKKCLPCTCVAR